MDSLLVVAYDLGKALKRLHFVSSLSFLGIRRFQDQVQSSFDCVRALARQIVQVSERDAVQQRVESQCRAFWRLMDPEFAAGETKELDQQLEEWSNCGPEPSPPRCCRAFLCTIDLMVDDLKQQVTSHLDSEWKSALALGYCVELGSCYADLQADLSPTSAMPMTTDEIDLEWDPLTLQWVTEVNPRAECRSISAEMPSVQSWVRDVKQRWSELVFPEAAFPLTDSSPTGEIDVVDVVATVDQKIRGAAARLARGATPPETSHQRFEVPVERAGGNTMQVERTIVPPPLPIGRTEELGGAETGRQELEAPMDNKPGPRANSPKPTDDSSGSVIGPPSLPDRRSASPRADWMNYPSLPQPSGKLVDAAARDVREVLTNGQPSKSNDTIGTEDFSLLVNKLTQKGHSGAAIAWALHFLSRLELVDGTDTTVQSTASPWAWWHDERSITADIRDFERAKTKSGSKKRPAYDRDHFWLQQYEKQTKHSNAKIRDEWNAMSEDARRAIAPTSSQKIALKRAGCNVVKEGLRKARKEKPDQASVN